jgi:penicillin-binding protein 2
MAQRFRFPGVEVRRALFRNYPLGEAGQPPDRLHRPHQPGREGGHGASGPRSARPTTAAPSTSASSAWSSATRRELHGTTGFEEVETIGRRPRRAPPAQPAGHAGQHARAVDRTSSCRRWWKSCSATAAARWWRSTRATARCWPSSASPPSTPTCSSTASTRTAGASSTSRIDKPLLNRALRGTYPPGSTYKPFMAMAALNSRASAAPAPIVTDAGHLPCSATTASAATATSGQRPGGHAPLDRASRSNVYYYSLANEMGVDLMHEQLSPFGFGRAHRHRPGRRGHRRCCPPPSGSGAPTSSPSSSSWYAGETISLGIGQGYNNFTMLQLASATATLVDGRPALRSRAWCARSRTRTSGQRERRGRARPWRRWRSSPSTWRSSAARCRA